jgi:hypothetical protein
MSMPASHFPSMDREGRGNHAAVDLAQMINVAAWLGSNWHSLLG